MAFFFEVLIGGLMAGVLYSLVALGFVLIFKASGVFNFAQGAMVLFAALTLVRLMEILKGTFSPFLLALAITIVVMIMLALVIERLVLRPLVNQAGIEEMSLVSTNHDGHRGVIILGRKTAEPSFT